MNRKQYKIPTGEIPKLFFRNFRIEYGGTLDLVKPSFTFKYELILHYYHVKKWFYLSMLLKGNFIKRYISRNVKLKLNRCTLLVEYEPLQMLKMSKIIEGYKSAYW